MATSTLKLYNIYAKRFDREKNFIIEDLAGYLSAAQVLTKNNFQYVPTRLNNTIVVVMDQNEKDNLSTSPSTAGFNYCSIVNSDKADFTAYYFITKYEWISEKAIKLYLKLDTLNTYSSILNFDKRTKVLREHKDRLESTEMDISHYSSYNAILTDGYEHSVQVTIPELAGIGDFEFIYTRILIVEQQNVDIIENTLQIASVTSAGTCKITFDVNSISPLARVRLQIKAVVRLSTYKRIIDPYSEGINPVLYGKEEEELHDDLDDTAYLYYRQNTDETNPLNTFLCFDTPQKTEKPNSDFTLSYTDFDSSYYYYLFDLSEIKDPTSGFKYWIFYSRGSFEADGEKYTSENRVVPVVKRNGSTLDIYLVKYRMIGNIWTGHAVKKEKHGITSIKVLAGNKIRFRKSSYDYENNLGKIWHNSVEEVYTKSDVTDVEIVSISQINRTDILINKIIKLPYSPATFEIDENGKLIIPEKWEYNSTYSLLEYDSANSVGAMNREIEFDVTKHPFSELFIRNFTPDKDDLRNDYLESKLFNSEFYKPKFIYDSFGFDFQLEYINDPEVSDYDKFKVYYSVTSTLNSKFMFKFTEYKCEGWEISDYNNILLISRNNEITIYNSPYLNYVRSGYNYDQKSKSLNNQSTIISNGIGAITNAVKQNYAGVVSNIYTGISSVTKAEWNIQQKLYEQSLQSVSVAGADDVDLLSEYSNNVAKLKFYEVSPKVHKMLADLFFYYGYVSNEMKIPETNSRRCFNFVQCEPVFDVRYDVTSKLDDDIYEDIVLKFKEGVTYFHKFKITGHLGTEVITWDLDQEYENYERSILDEEGN